MSHELQGQIAQVTGSTAGIGYAIAQAQRAAGKGVTTFIADFAKAQGVSETQFEADFFRTARPSSLRKRFLDPNEIASVVAFQASPAASAITGAAVRAEGGLPQSAW